MSHFDGPLFYPTISTVSIGSHTVLEFHQPRSQDEENLAMTAKSTLKLLVEPRSLLILKDDLYHRYMHSIESIEEDDLSDPLIKNVKTESASGVVKRGTRFSLTIRWTFVSSLTALVTSNGLWGCQCWVTKISFSFRNVPKTSKMKLKFGK